MEIDKIFAQLGRNILFLRSYYGMSQKTLAKLLGISPHRLRAVEAGSPQARLYDFHLRRLSEIFHISADALVGTEISQS